MTDHNGNVSYRELVAMLEALTKEIDAKFEGHYTRHEKDHEVHQTIHDRERDQRTGYMRWAVTTLMTGLGVLVAIYAAFGRA